MNHPIDGQTVTHNGCTVKVFAPPPLALPVDLRSLQIYHKECYCGSQSDPTSCCVDDEGKGLPFKSIYCAKNGDDDNQASDLPECAEAMLSWIASDLSDGYLGSVNKAEKEIRPKQSWQH